MAAIDITLNAVDKASDTLAGVAGSFSAFGEVATGALRRVGEVAVNAIGSAVGAIGQFAVSSFQGAIEAEAGIAKLNAALERAGENAPVTGAEALALADSLKGLAGGSDDTVIAVETLLTKFGVSKDVFAEATKTSLDLAAVLGVSAPQAAETLGKALLTPGEGLAKLKAAGIDFTDAQGKQIEAMVAAGDVAGAQQFILTALAETTGGAAAAAAETLSGKWAIFQETISDAGEGIAAGLLPVLSTLFDSIISPAMPIIEALASRFGDWVSALAEATSAASAFEIILEPLEAIFISLGVSIENQRDIFETLWNAFETTEETIRGFIGYAIANFPLWRDAVVSAIQSFLDLVQPIIDAVINLAGKFSEDFPAMQSAATHAFEFIQDTVDSIMPVLVENISGALNQLAAFWDAHGQTIIAAVTLAFEFIAGFVAATLVLVTGVINTALAAINGDWEAAGAALTSTTTAFMETVLSIVGTNLDTFTETWRTNWELLVEIVTTVVGNIVTAIVSGAAQFVASATTAAQDIVAVFTDTDWGAVGTAIIEGIGVGISNAAQGLAEQAAAAAYAAYQAAADAIGWNSPPKLFVEMGEAMIDAVGVGIKKQSSKLNAVISKAILPPDIPALSDGEALKDKLPGALAAILNPISPGADVGGNPLIKKRGGGLVTSPVSSTRISSSGIDTVALARFTAALDAATAALSRFRDASTSGKPGGARDDELISLLRNFPTDNARAIRDAVYLATA